jgi:hypothetical protein
LHYARFLFCNKKSTLQKIFGGRMLEIGLFEVLTPKLLAREPYIIVRRGA